MDAKIISKEENPLLSRTEVKADITFSGVTPSRKILKSAIANELKKKDDMVVIHKVNQQFGFGKAVIEAVVYSDKKAMSEVEQKYMPERGMKESKKAEPEKKEEKPAEKKDEGKAAAEKPAGKEEAKSEEKPAESDKKEDKPKGEAEKEEQPEKKEDKAEDKEKSE